LVGSGRGIILRYYPSIRLEGLRKATENVSKDSRSPGPKFEPENFLIRSRSVNHSITTFGTLEAQRTVGDDIKKKLLWKFIKNNCNIISDITHSHNLFYLDILVKSI
jgi:hypothetical protein